MSMLAVSVRRKWLFATAALTAVLYTVAVLRSAVSAENEQIPNFSPDNVTGWLKPPGDEFLPPASGPGPVKSDPAHPYVSNAVARQETVKIADLTNPILQPWAIEQMRKANEEVLAGKVPFRARERCYPAGVPAYLVYTLAEPIYIIQTPKQVTFINQGGPEVRRVYLDRPHSAKVTPSWYGESVGHYENGDTLVVDTIGISTKSFIDN